MRVLLPIGLLLLPAAAMAQFAPTPRVPTPRIGPFVPAAGPADPDSRRETHDIRARIDRGRDAGQLSRREARGLRRGTGAIEAMAGRYAADGLSDAEARELSVRAHVLRDEVLARRSGVDLRPATARAGQRGR